MERSVPQIRIPSLLKPRDETNHAIKIPIPHNQKYTLAMSKPTENEKLQNPRGLLSRFLENQCKVGSSKWSSSEMGDDDVTVADEDDAMSDTDEAYAIVIRDTLDSSPAGSQCVDVKTENTDHWDGTARGGKPTYQTCTDTCVPRYNEHHKSSYNQNIQSGSSDALMASSLETVTVKQETDYDNFATGMMATTSLSSRYTANPGVVGQADDHSVYNRCLPQVITEVMERQKGQSTEIQHQQHQLLALQTQYEKEIKENHYLKDEVAMVTHDISMTQKSVLEKTKEYEDLQRDLVHLVSICEDFRQAARYKLEEVDLEKRNIESYHNKMADYKCVIAQEEDQGDLMRQLREHQQYVQDLGSRSKYSSGTPDLTFGFYEEEEIEQEEYSRIMDGSLEKEVTEHIQSLKEKIKEMESLMEEKYQLTEEVTQQQKLVQQSVLVLHKRNTAQLTRLKRQLKEVHMRRRRWNDQITQLQKAVADLRQKLEE